MGESTQHAFLVKRILDWIELHHGNNPGLCVLADIGSRTRSDKPRPIGGYVPDVFAITVPSSFTIIGEAKWLTDLHRPHTRLQLAAYLKYLTHATTSELILSIPLSFAGHAAALAQSVRRQCAAESVPVRLLFNDCDSELL